MKPITTTITLDSRIDHEDVDIDEVLKKQCVIFYCIENQMTEEQTRKTIKEKDVIFVFEFGSKSGRYYDSEKEEHYTREHRSCVMKLL